MIPSEGSSYEDDVDREWGPSLLGADACWQFFRFPMGIREDVVLGKGKRNMICVIQAADIRSKVEK